jgi:TPR repeat protein
VLKRHAALASCCSLTLTLAASCSGDEGARKPKLEGEGRDFNRLGANYANGEGVPQDYAKAANYYQKACDADFPLGCSNLGALSARGQGLAKDDKKAATLFRRACDMGDALGCVNLGMVYESGAGIQSDPVKARAAYKKACDQLRDEREFGRVACNNLGVMMELGTGGAVDKESAGVLYDKACKSGHRDACDNLERL